ncbi:MAG TPA: dihydroneopterin aldolase [Stellaceae bacterium]|nr:dihydroneopterin aldolase [Stellaceae bacterium]
MDDQRAAPSIARDAAASSYRIFVRNLIVAASIGIHAHEKRQRGRLRVSAELEIAAALPKADDFAEVVDYETIVAGIKRIAGTKHINLVESFADQVASLCLSDRRVSFVRVAVEKLDIYPEAESVGVVIERRRRAG